MGKLAFVFPGQGAQYVGMGKEFYEQISVSRKVYTIASEVTGLNLPGLCFEKNEQNPLETDVIIIDAMLTTEAAILAALQEKGVKADVAAGLSLGEYGAILTAGAMSLEDVFRVVRQRGILMQEAVPTGGAMCAVLGMDGEKIAKICDETEGIVSVANYNCPGQIVITGEEGAVAVAAEKLKEAGARRCIPLNVSGPFHSAMLKEAGEKLGKVLEQVELRAFSTPYVTNVTAEYVTEPSEIKELLGRQVYSSVKWQQSVERMIADGVDTFIEIGPGRTLTGFLKKINKNVTGLHIEKVEDLDAVVKMLGEKQ